MLNILAKMIAHGNQKMVILRHPLAAIVGPLRLPIPWVMSRQITFACYTLMDLDVWPYAVSHIDALLRGKNEESIRRSRLTTGTRLYPVARGS